MCKFVEIKWTREEIESYIRCCYDQLLIMAKEKSFKIPTTYITLPIPEKAKVICNYMLMRTSSEKVVENCLKYYGKICEFNALLKLELYN